MVITSLTLFGLGTVHADPGTFDSHPTAHTIDTISVTNPTYAYDENLATSADFNYKQGPPGGFEVNTFTTSPVNFSILSVDFKMNYMAADGGTKANYQISYYVDPSPTQTILVAWTGTPHAAATDVWATQPEPNDLSWNWTDISNIRFLVETTKVSGGGSVDFEEYEAWVTVHTGAAPTPKLTVEPPTIDELSPGSNFYIEVWITDAVGLWGYEFNMSYNTDVLTATAFSSNSPFFIPWGTPGIDDAIGEVYMAYSMTLGDPEGFTGTQALCRIDFSVDAAGGSLLDLHDSVLSTFLGEEIEHDVYDGVYSTPVPEFPLGMAVELALIVALAYIWLKRKSHKRTSKLSNHNTLTL